MCDKMGLNNYFIGCNYWASNAGAEMWVNFDEKAIAGDLKTLSEHGLTVLRVFPNWRDFQPVFPLYVGDRIVEYRLSGERLPQNKYYLDEIMLERFDIFLKIAEKYGLKLIVGLITGWMSGRLFIPPALYGKNLYTDPTALLMQQKFIAGFVNRFKDKDVIWSWDLGNECNCMFPLDDRHDRHAAHNWTLALSNCIRANDNSRPVISGMHSLSIDGTWTIEDQADGADILTTHPYPYWVPHCRVDSYTKMRTLLHASCETKYYSDIGGKPCLVEEIGTMGPMNCDDETAALFAKVNLYSNWANKAAGMMWWCANEQTDLLTPPYTWNMCEVELGMTDRTGKPKPLLREFKRFSEFLFHLDFELPIAYEDGVLILSKDQDHWGIAYMAYVLAKQAGVNLRFANGELELPDSSVYLLPSVKGHLVMAREKYLALIEKVRNGATLYLSNDDCILANFAELTGLKIEDSCKSERLIKANGAEVLVANQEEMPIFTKYNYGKGTVYYLDYPLEAMLLNEYGAFERQHYTIYEEVFNCQYDTHIVWCDNKNIGVTQHFGKEKSYAVLINYSGESISFDLSINKKYKLKRLIGDAFKRIEPFGVIILEFEMAGGVM
ncbi:MAG: cellulase family glycosylhydrolase [Lachnospiraceae bacterium]|nr:cellulase family glycosylhydrolase [Lachnospiraceae bacterium]